MGNEISNGCMVVKDIVQINNESFFFFSLVYLALCTLLILLCVDTRIKLSCFVDFLEIRQKTVLYTCPG
ncbi:hypothetical protein VNO77_17024 [Canavalia gladiata]|uniref:Uncharacterized protein n=1 Tax=Canavalia gladiata TaxID=3824 RepID=A0AAN9QIE1_CANGL